MDIFRFPFQMLTNGSIHLSSNVFQNANIPNSNIPWRKWTDSNKRNRFNHISLAFTCETKKKKTTISNLFITLHRIQFMALITQSAVMRFYIFAASYQFTFHNRQLIGAKAISWNWFRFVECNANWMKSKFSAMRPISVTHVTKSGLAFIWIFLES